MHPSTIHATRVPPSPHTSSHARSGPSPSRPIARAVGPRQRDLRRCPICGSAELRIDEVVDRGALLLAECPRCEHRWTQPATGPYVVRPPARPVEEAVSAA